VVALSALPLDNDADWRLAGFAGHVAKPISVGEFSEHGGAAEHTTISIRAARRTG
jgi:hypothetical protein